MPGNKQADTHQTIPTPNDAAGIGNVERGQTPWVFNANKEGKKRNNQTNATEQRKVTRNGQRRIITEHPPKD